MERRATTSKGHLSAWVETARWDGDGDLVALGLHGDRNAVQAVLADLGSSTTPRLPIGGESLGRRQGTKYRSWRVDRPGGELHAVLLRADALGRGTPGQPYYVVAPDPSVGWWDRFRRECLVPLRPGWREWAWAAGRQAELVTLAEGWGMPAARVDPDDEEWAPLVGAAVAEGLVA